MQCPPGTLLFYAFPDLQFRATIPACNVRSAPVSHQSIPEIVASSSIMSRIVPIRIQQNKVDNHSAPPRPPRKILELQFRAQNNSNPELLNYQKETRFFQQFRLRVISIIYHQCGMVFQDMAKNNRWDPDFSALSEMHKKMKCTSIANPQIC